MDLYPGGLSDAPMRAIPITIVLSALLMAAPLPLGSAGTEQAPEITDPANDTQPPSSSAYADIVAAWITDDATKVTTYVKLAQLPPNPPPGNLYIFGFKHHEGCESYYTYYWINNTQGQNAPEYKQGVFDDCNGLPSRELVTTGTAPTQGVPVAKVEFKKQMMPSHFKGDRLYNLTALIIDTTAFNAFIACLAGDAACQAAGALAQQTANQTAFPDSASTTKTYALAASPEPPEPEVVEDMPMHNGTDSGSGATDGESNTTGSSESANTPGFETLLVAAALASALVWRRRKAY